MKKFFIILVLVIISLFKTELVCAENIYKEYKIGDTVTYNGMEFYVIENSYKDKDYVTLLKKEPLTVDEVNKYGAGHLNRYTNFSVGTAHNNNGYGGMAYYSSEKCGYVNDSWIRDGCTTDYDESEVKYAVDAWANDKLNVSDLTEDSLGYKTRLLTFEDLTNNLGYGDNGSGTIQSSKNGDTPSWVYNEKYWYWTMSPYDDSDSRVWHIYSGGGIGSAYVYSFGDYYAVRPVINLKKDPVGKKKKLTDKVFNIGDMITYNGMDFYVIEDSGKDKNYVTLLKDTPLTDEELFAYGVDGLGSLGNDYWGVYYYRRTGIECADPKNRYNKECCIQGAILGCKSDYELSDIKKIVDAWAIDKLNDMDLIEDSTGYKVRLLTKAELIDKFNFVERKNYEKISYINSSLTPYFVVNNNYQYWIMNPVINDTEVTMGVSYAGTTAFAGDTYVFSSGGAVRPVITLKKVNKNHKEEIKNDENNKENKEIVSVPDTFLKKSVTIVIIGLIMIIIGVITSYIVIKKKRVTKSK